MKTIITTFAFIFVLIWIISHAETGNDLHVPADSVCTAWKNGNCIEVKTVKRIKELYSNGLK